jgi:hypothetical protein
MSVANITRWLVPAGVLAWPGRAEQSPLFAANPLGIVVAVDD